MNGQKWIKIFILISFILIVLLVTINIKYSDSYGILQKNYDGLYREPNQNFVKMKFLLNHEHDYDSFIFGSSRVGAINPKLIPDSSYYNMTYSEGVPLEHLENIKLLLKSNLKIKNIMLGLDDFSYQVNPERHLKEPLRKPHYLTSINNETIVEFYSEYFFKIPSLYDLQCRFVVSCQNFNYDIYDTGSPLIPKEIEMYIENNREAHINDKKFEETLDYQQNRINQTLKEIGEIIALSKQHNFNLILFINPIHAKTYLANNFEHLQFFKKELSKLSSFYDFSGLNAVTTNNYYYYEHVHYRTMVGEMIIDKIFNKTTKLPKSFGSFVNAKNINQHLVYLVNQRIKYINDIN